ncbi:hypothetical protein GCM10027075_76700 [Streptomyces heilongjiangensis]
MPAALGTASPQALADAMHSAWVRFVYHGDPGRRPASEGTGMRWDTADEEVELFGADDRLARPLWGSWPAPSGNRPEQASEQDF